MLYINPKSRDDLGSYRTLIYNHLKANKLRYSDQRERVLKILHSQSHPVSVDYLVNKINDKSSSANYATVLRHLHLFNELNILQVIDKIPRGYLLVKNVDIEAEEVLNYIGK